MLSRFIIKNFRSIRELVVDFSYGEGKAPNRYLQSDTIFFHEKRNKNKKKERFVPCLAFYGANASGKTNILRAMDRFIRIIKDGVSSGRFDPNLLNPLSNKTSFWLEFYLDKDKFIYSIEYDADEIYAESLIRNSNTLFSVNKESIDFSAIETEEYPGKRLQEIYNVEGGGNYRRRSFLSVIGNRYEGLNKDLTSVYRFFVDGILVFGNNEIPASAGADFLAKIYDKREKISDPIQQAFKMIAGELKKLDIDIADIAFKRETIEIKPGKLRFTPDIPIKSVSIGKDGKAIANLDEITTWHKDINGNLVKFNFDEAESAGTQILVGLLGVLLKALHEGNVVMIDELDRSLHPFLLNTIVRMFKSKQRNTRGAQLMFTAHDVYLLEDEKLRVSEIGIVRKNLKNGTTVVRLCEDKDLRNVSNFKRLYLDGVYGGIPYPYI